MKETTFDLWRGDAPGKTHREIPRIHCYEPEKRSGKGAVIIFPGGSYGTRSAHEGACYARRINEMGLSAFVVDYRVTNWVEPGVFPDPQLDARRAVRFVRKNADKFGIDADKIAVMGSSAGGHLVASLSTYRDVLSGEGADEIDDMDDLPNGQVLCYPVIDRENHEDSYKYLLGEELDELCSALNPAVIADGKTPPAFIWHTAADKDVNVSGSYRYASKLRELDIPVEMHIFPYGPHGLGLGVGDYIEALPYVQIWPELLERWLRLFGFKE